jgi:ribosomal protein S27AE
VDPEELESEHSRSSHPDHFSAGYQDGLDEALNSHKVVAVLVGGMDDMPKGMQVTAHVSGNQIDVLHCPFCGSGAVIARSDGTIECGYCTSIFTVQVQPAYAGFPQSVDGQPYQWPGMPDPNSVMAPDAPPGTNVNPLAQDPGMGAPPLGDGGLLGVDGGGAPESSDPSEGGFGGDEEGDDDSEGGGNPFAKGKDDKKSDDKKSDKKPPTKKSSSLLLKTASGAQLDAAEFEAHLAMKYAKDPLVVAQRVREARAKGLL